MKPYPTLSCPAYAEIVDAVLDRTAPIQLLDHPHVQSCRSCHSLSMAARQIIAGVTRPIVSVYLAQRIVNAALAERQARQRKRSQLRVAAMVAMLLMGVVSFSVWRQNDSKMQTDVAKTDSNSKSQPPVGVAQIEPKPPRLEESVNEASDALMAMTGGRHLAWTVYIAQFPRPLGVAAVDGRRAKQLVGEPAKHRKHRDRTRYEFHPPGVESVHTRHRFRHWTEIKVLIRETLYVAASHTLGWMARTQLHG